jgi:hypothetical protein
MEATIESIQTATSQKPPLISKRELSAELHKSCRTIEIWVKAGYSSCIKVGHSVFFDREQVLADLRRFQIGGTASR